MTGLATGAGLAITLIGIPILTLVLASVRPLLAAERAMANALLGTDIPAAPLAPQGDGWFGRLKAYWTDTPTWRGLGVPARALPGRPVHLQRHGLRLRRGAGLIAAPLLAPLDADGLELGIWQPDSVLEGLALVPLGLVLLVAAGWISEGMAAMSRELARWGAR